MHWLPHNCQSPSKLVRKDIFEKKAYLIVKAEPNSILCVSTMTYKFVLGGGGGGGTTTKKTTFQQSAVITCSDKRSCTHHIGFISQTLKGRSEQQRSPATREPAHQVLTEADLQRFDHNFFVCKKQQNTTDSLQLLPLQLKQQEHRGTQIKPPKIPA